MENRIKEAKDAFRLDQDSFTSMLANQFPLLLTLAAFALLQLLRLHAARTEPARPDGHPARAPVSSPRECSTAPARGSGRGTRTPW